jgi:hypothetical protein
MTTSSKTEVKRSSLGGRGLFATCPIEGGDVLIELERPLIAVLDRPRIEDTCSWCFSWTELPVLSGAGVNQALKVNWCTGCRKVKYCSKRCQSQAWKGGHKQECKRLASQEEAFPNLVAATMQVISGLNAEDKAYEEIKNSETHRDDFERVGGKKWEAMLLMSHTAVKLLDLKDDQSNLEQAKKVISTIMCSTHRLVTPTFDPLGLAFDPSTSTINHSCLPNAVIVFDGPKLVVRALDPIKAGQEVLISYIDSSAPFGVRQAELKDQYFFECSCAKCKLSNTAPQDAFLKPTAEFEQRISVIDDMIPQIVKDSAWSRHILGDTTDLKRLSALQFYAYSFLGSPDAETMGSDPAKLRKSIIILRNTCVWPITRAPLPALYQQYSVACLGARRYNEALIALIRLYTLIDPTIYPQAYHPVRIVHAWVLATLAKAVSSEPDTPFCKALQACGVDLPILFLALLQEIHNQIPRSHGVQSSFGKTIETAWQSIMGAGGELDVQYSQQRVRRPQQQQILNEQIKELWPKIETFARDDALAAQIDEALAG